MKHLLIPAGALAALLLAAAAPRATAQEIVSQTLTDKIYQGSGTINLLNDLSSTDLSGYLNEHNGILMLGVDVNENNAGNETSDSLGVAIKQVQLTITTTTGTFTFGDFFTSTTAVMRESGSTTSQEYYTLFGQAGSSALTGASGFNLSTYDDVLWLENIEVTGEILSAQLSVKFLDTPKNQATSNESFFDYTGGFEDFALLSTVDAVTLEEANIGAPSQSSGITYTSTTTVTEALGVDAAAIITVPAAPAPPLAYLAAAAGLAIFRLRKSARQ